MDNNVFAFDNGYGYTKARCNGRSVIFPSVVGEALSIRFDSGMAESVSGERLVVDSQGWFVGTTALSQSRTHQQSLSATRTGSTEQKVLFHAALAKLRPSTESSLVVVTGLPVADYSPQNKRSLQSLLEGIQTVYTDGAAQTTYHVGRAVIVPQLFGTLASLVLDESGTFSDLEGLRNKSVGIIDIGTYTINAALFERMAYIEKSSNSFARGMHLVLEAVQKDIASAYGVQIDDLAIVDELVRQYFITLYGERVNIDEVIGRAVAPLASDLISRLHSLWNGGALLDAVIVTGGGGPVFRPRIESAFKHARLVENSQWANCIGYERWGARLLRA